MGPDFALEEDLDALGERHALRVAQLGSGSGLPSLLSCSKAVLTCTPSIRPCCDMSWRVAKHFE